LVVETERLRVRGCTPWSRVSGRDRGGRTRNSPIFGALALLLRRICGRAVSSPPPLCREGLN